MDKTIIKLLFSYKGTISSQEFRVGMTIVFISIWWYILENFILNIAMSGIGQYSYIMSNYIPQIIPVGFISTVSIFLLTVKRVRAFFNNKVILILSGVLSFLFLSSATTMLLLAQIGSNYYVEFMEDIFKYIFIAITIILFLGFVNMIFLAIPRKSEPGIIKPTTGGLDVLSYTMKTGTLVGISTGIFIIISFIFAIEPSYKMLLIMFIGYEAIYVPLISLFIILLGFYMKYSASRLKNAGKSIFWLVGILVGYIVFVTATVWMGAHQGEPLNLFLNTALSIVTSFFIASQYLLFLLPAKARGISGT